VSARTPRTCSHCGARFVGTACLACLRRRLAKHAGQRKKTRQRARRKRTHVKTDQRPGADRVAGIALLPWLEHMARLPVFGGEDSRLTDNLPRLHVRRARSKPKRRLAFADYDRHLLHLTDYPGITPADALETLLHEVVHLQSLDLRRHDARFKRTLARAAKECFGIECRPIPRATWALDQRIVERIAALPPESLVSPGGFLGE
jgi:hypothetical protein